VGQNQLDHLNLAPCRHLCRWRSETRRWVECFLMHSVLMHRWSVEHRAFAVETFFKNNGSASVMQRVFRRHFDIGRNGKVPTRHTILNWVIQFRTTASIVNKKPSGRLRTVRTPENVRRVSHAFQRSPQRSARRHSVALHLSPKSVSTVNARCSTDQRCMMTEGFKPLYPVMCVSLRHLHTCRHGAKFKSAKLLFSKKVSTANARCSSDQRCIMPDLRH
jgi:hypothetical protein